MKTVWKKHTIDILFGVCVIGLLPFLFWKCKFGYGGGDESFYITLARRFANGDAPLSEEWNLAQLSGLLLVPFYKMHGFIFGGNEGIVLHFRYFYVVMHTLLSVSLYLALRKYKLGAALGALIYYIYTPYDLMALSYNTMGVGMFCLALALQVRAADSVQSETAGKARIWWLLSGLCYGMAVLCNPYLILVYALYAVVQIVCGIVRKKAPVALIFTTLGAAVMALYLFLMVLTKVSFDALFANLSYMLNDPEHGGQGLYAIVYTYIYSIIDTYKYYLLAWLIILVTAALDRGRSRFSVIYFGMTALLAAIQILMLADQPQSNYNLVMFPLAFVGITAFVLTKKKQGKVLLAFYGAGFLFTFCASMSSNQGINVICQGMPILLMGGTILMMEFVHELKENAKFSMGLAIFFCITAFGAQIGTQVYMKAVHAFWEPPVQQLQSEIVEGPLAGVLTSKEHAEAYEALLSDMKQMKALMEESEDAVFVVTTQPWTYLYLDQPMGVHSSWISSTYAKERPEDLLIHRVTQYYALHEDRVPQWIYVSAKDAWAFDESQLTKVFSFGDREMQLVSELPGGYVLRSVR